MNVLKGNFQLGFDIHFSINTVTKHSLSLEYQVNPTQLLCEREGPIPFLPATMSTISTIVPQLIWATVEGFAIRYLLVCKGLDYFLPVDKDGNKNERIKSESLLKKLTKH